MKSGVTGQACIGLGVHKALCPQRKVCTELGWAGQESWQLSFLFQSMFFSNLVDYDCHMLYLFYLFVTRYSLFVSWVL